MIDFDLGDELRLIRDTVRDFAAREIRPRLREVEAARAVPDVLVRGAHELGLGLLAVPESAGGQGLGALAEVVVAEELAAGDPGVAAALPGPGAAGTALGMLGNDAQVGRWLAPMAASPDARGALALTDDLGPGEPAPVRARKDGEAWVVEGRKVFVRGLPGARVAVVSASLDDGGTAMLVLEGEEIVAGEPFETDGLAALPLGRLELGGVRVPADRLLGGAPASPRQIGALMARVGLTGAAWAVGCARAAYGHALDYAHERHAFGRPIGQFQAVAFSLTDMLMEVEAARAMVWRAASALDHGREDARLLTAQAVGQSYDMVMRVTSDAVQVLGGAGYVKDHPVEKWMRDARVLTFFGLSREAADLMCAAELLGDAEARPPAEQAPAGAAQPLIS